MYWLHEILCGKEKYGEISHCFLKQLGKFLA